MVAHDSVHDGKPQARAHAHGFVVKKGSKTRWRISGEIPAPESEISRNTCFRSALHVRTRIFRPPTDPSRACCAFRSKFKSCLLHLHRIGQQERQIRPELELERDIFHVQFVAAKSSGAPHNIVQIHGLAFGGRVSREEQQALHDSARRAPPPGECAEPLPRSRGRAASRSAIANSP